MEKRKPCKGMWNSINVDVDGNVTTCCLDVGMRNKIGNLKDNGLFELWHSEKIERWRMAQIEGRFEDSGPFCMECNYLAAEQMTKEEIEEYLAERG